MASAVSISRKEMDDFLLPQGFQLIPNLPHTVELVYGKIVRKEGQAFSLRIYSSINPNGESRTVGSDAIRVTTWVRNKDGVPVKVGGDKRVHRVAGWRNNLQQRIDRWADKITVDPQLVAKESPVCPLCGKPTRLRTPKEGQTFKPFYGCSAYPECRGTVKT